MSSRSTAGARVASATGGGRLAVLTTVDQVLSSASNALVVLTLAQVSTAEQFGVIALMVTTVSVCGGFTRGALGTPLLLTSALRDDEIVAESGYAVSWSLGIGVVAGIVIAVGGIAIDEAAVGLAFALSISFVLAQDVLRMAAFALRRPGCALVADAVWTGVVLLVFVANLVGAHVSASVTVYVWGVSGLGSVILLAGWIGVRPHTYRIRDWWSTYASARLRFGSLPASGQIAVLLVIGSAAAIVGGAAAAGLRGAMTLFGPITMLVAALPMVFVPHAARTRHAVASRTLWHQLALTSLITSGATLLAAFCLVKLPTALGSALLGQTWGETLQLVPCVGAQWAAMAWLVSIFTLFQSGGSSRAVLWLNVLHISLQVCAAVTAGLVFHSAIAMGLAIAASGWSAVVVGLLMVQVWLRRDTRETPTSTDCVVDVEANGAVAA